MRSIKRFACAAAIFWGCFVAVLAATCPTTGTCPTLPPAVNGDTNAPNASFTLTIDNGLEYGTEQYYSGDTTTEMDDIAPALDSLNNQGSTSNSNGNGTGTSFAFGPPSSDPSNSSPPVTLVFDTTTTNPGAVASTVPTLDYSTTPPTVVSAVTTIYLNSQDCGGPCFNTSATSFSTALQTVIQHEMYHLLGVGDSQGAYSPSQNGNTLMGYWVGVNNTGFTSTGTQIKIHGVNAVPEASGPSCCDNAAVKKWNACPSCRPTPRH